MHAAAGKHNTDDVAYLNVTCSASSALVSWSASAGSVVNLQYHCFWTKNNTQVSSELNSCHAALQSNAVITIILLQVSKHPVIFEERSDYSDGLINLTSTALMDGVYCIFGGSYQLDSGPYLEFPRTTCGTCYMQV